MTIQSKPKTKTKSNNDTWDKKELGDVIKVFWVFCFFKRLNWYEVTCLASKSNAKD